MLGTRLTGFNTGWASTILAADITIAHPTNGTKLLIKAYALGIMDIAESYQGSVKLVEALTTVKQGDAWSSE